MSKPKYYYVWIEGLSPKRGEKLKQFIESHRQEDYVITTRMSDAMRVKPEDVETVKEKLRSLGVADWVLDSLNTFIPIKYAPAGTVFIP